MGKICPQCGYHFADEPIYQEPSPSTCQHQFYIEYDSPTSPQVKWRCKKCSEVRYTNVRYAID
jgi:hypothetical protein